MNEDCPILEITAEEASKNAQISDRFLSIYKQKIDYVLPILESICDVIEKYSREGFTSVHMQLKEPKYNLLLSDSDVRLCVIKILKHNGYRVKVCIDGDSKYKLTVAWEKEVDNKAYFML